MSRGEDGCFPDPTCFGCPSCSGHWEYVGPDHRATAICSSSKGPSLTRQSCRPRNKAGWGGPLGFVRWSCHASLKTLTRHVPFLNRMAGIGASAASQPSRCVSRWSMAPPGGAIPGRARWNSPKDSEGQGLENNVSRVLSPSLDFLYDMFSQLIFLNL